jgi:hypothetical protein
LLSESIERAEPHGVDEEVDLAFGRGGVVGKKVVQGGAEPVGVLEDVTTGGANEFGEYFMDSHACRAWQAHCSRGSFLHVRPTALVIWS